MSLRRVAKRSNGNLCKTKPSLDGHRVLPSSKADLQLFTERREPWFEVLEQRVKRLQVNRKPTTEEWTRLLDLFQVPSELAVIVADGEGNLLDVLDEIPSISYLERLKHR